MKIQIHPQQINLWVSGSETYLWARKPGAAWPCSFLAGRRFSASFDRNGLADFQIDGGRGDQDCPSDEFSAICADFIGRHLKPEHALYSVTVGQFLPAST